MIQRVNERIECAMVRGCGYKLKVQTSDFGVLRKFGVLHSKHFIYRLGMDPLPYRFTKQYRSTASKNTSRSSTVQHFIMIAYTPIQSAASFRAHSKLHPKRSLGRTCPFLTRAFLPPCFHPVHAFHYLVRQARTSSSLHTFALYTFPSCSIVWPLPDGPATVRMYKAVRILY